jgi:outer membrane receptor protein involved in Fe transport
LLIAPWHNSLDIYTVRDDFSKVAGAHTLRFGGFMGWQGKNEVNNGTSFSEYPQFATADWDTSIPTGNELANLLVPGAQWGFSEQSTNLFVHIRWRDYELYAADNWKLLSNLTVDAGIRYSILAPPFQPDNQFTSFPPKHTTQTCHQALSDSSPFLATRHAPMTTGSSGLTSPKLPAARTVALRTSTITSSRRVSGFPGTRRVAEIQRFVPGSASSISVIAWGHLSSTPATPRSF